jgi:hypothetical protein
MSVCLLAVDAFYALGSVISTYSMQAHVAFATCLATFCCAVHAAPPPCLGHLRSSVMYRHSCCSSCEFASRLPAVVQRWAIPMVRYRILANLIRYIGTEIHIGMRKRFPISVPIGSDNTLQSRKIYIQTSKRTWISHEGQVVTEKEQCWAH